MSRVIDLDGPIDPAAMPTINLGDVLRWWPVVQGLIETTASVLTTGSGTAPMAKIRIHGQVLDIGPTPIKREG